MSDNFLFKEFEGKKYISVEELREFFLGLPRNALEVQMEDKMSVLCGVTDTPELDRFLDNALSSGGVLNYDNGDLMFDLDEDDYAVAECIWRAVFLKSKEDPLHLEALLQDPDIRRVVNARTSTTLSDEVPMVEGEKMDEYIVRLHNRLADYNM